MFDIHDEGGKNYLDVRDLVEILISTDPYLNGQALYDMIFEIMLDYGYKVE